MYMDPTTHLWLVEQDRERTMTQRALERAARSGGEQRPGLARGGILAVAKVLKTAGTTFGQLRLGGTGTTTELSGSAGI